MSGAIFSAVSGPLKNHSVMQIYVAELGWFDVAGVDHYAGNTQLTLLKLDSLKEIVVRTDDLRAFRKRSAV